MTFLRFLMLLSLVVWLGGLLFFPVVAQTAFSLLGSRAQAGLVVGHALVILHWMGIAAGVVFLVCSLMYSFLNTKTLQILALRNIAILGMLALTCVSQFSIIPRMDVLRASIAGERDSVPADFPARAQFDALHVWSTRLEEGVMVLGLFVVFLLARSWRDEDLRPDPAK